MSLRVALTRPIDDARRSAEALRARGFDPVLAPVMILRATGAAPPEGQFDALLATSANAFLWLSTDAGAALRGLALYAAGERTAAAARDAGLSEARAISEDSAGLVALIAARLQRPSRLLYLTARDRKGDLEATLGVLGHRVVASEVYVAEARDDWTADEIRAVAACGAMAHYSRRSANLALALAARAHLGAHFHAALHACLSQDAAEPLRAFGATRIAVANGPREALLIDALSAAAGGQ